MKSRWSVPVRDVFFELVRCGLWSVKPKFALFGKLNAGDWNDLYNLVREQAVTGICFPVLEMLPEPLRPPRPLYLSWLGQAEWIKMKNIRMRETLLELNERFERQGIYPVLLKGLGSGAWYTEPKLRMTGDIDLYIPGRYDDAVALVKSWGYEITYMPQHDKFQYNGIWVELHHSIINPGYLADVPGKTVYVADDESRYRVPCEEANMFLLLTHAARHLMGAGMGIRHLCDYTLFLHYNHSELDHILVSRLIKKAGISRFVMEFTALAIDYLDLDPVSDIADRWLGDAKEKYERLLLEDMLENGDCGRHMFDKRQKMCSIPGAWGWFYYYSASFIRLVKLCPLWPSYVRKILCRRAADRLKLVLRGKPFSAG